MKRPWVKPTVTSRPLGDRKIWYRCTSCQHAFGSVEVAVTCPRCGAQELGPMKVGSGGGI